jgi:hypothetical protein
MSTCDCAIFRDYMDFLPKEPIWDAEMYSEQMDGVLSEQAKKAKGVLVAPRRPFDRKRFLDAMAEAFEVIGGVPRLAIWADSNPTEFYKLMGKTIPQANLLDIQGKMQMQILPAMPPSPLDDEPIDVTPEKRGE